MEELLDTRRFVVGHDFRFFPHHLHGTCHFNFSGEWSCRNTFLKLSFPPLTFFFFYLWSGHDCPDQVFPGNHHHRVQSLSFLRPALVQDAQLVRTTIKTLFIIIHEIFLSESVLQFCIWPLGEAVALIYFSFSLTWMMLMNVDDSEQV